MARVEKTVGQGREDEVCEEENAPNDMVITNDFVT